MAPTTSRRAFVRAAGAGVLAGGLALGASGSAAGRGIATPWLQRDGNLLVDPQGERVRLRGVNVVDPARADKQFWRHPVEETVSHATDPSKDWYARIIRVPVAPGELMGGNGEGEAGVLEKGPLEDFLANLLDPVVDRCENVGAYCIVDYHRHKTDDYTRQAIHDELTLFWETVAPRYADRSHVMYEVYNEPIGPYAGQCQSCSVDVLDDAAQETWTTWKNTAQPWVDTIRDHASDNVVIIGSPRWTQWTYWAQHDEFDGNNLAYAGHVYTHENLRPLADYFGDPSESVPVFLSEFGYQNKRHDGAPVPEFLKGTTSTAGEEFRTFLENYPAIHWQAWCFDHSWAPPMFSFDDATHEWTLQGGEDWQGVFFQTWLKDKRDQDLPTGSGTVTATPTDTATETPTDTPSCSAPTAPAWSDGTAPADVDGDGVYEDMNGNCEFDSDDVVTYFQNIDRAGIQSNPTYYDANGNGNADFDDIVTLFQSL